MSSRKIKKVTDSGNRGLFRQGEAYTLQAEKPQERQSIQPSPIWILLPHSGHFLLFIISSFERDWCWRGACVPLVFWIAAGADSGVGSFAVAIIGGGVTSCEKDGAGRSAITSICSLWAGEKVFGSSNVWPFSSFLLT